MSRRPATADWQALGVHVRLVVTEPAALATARALLSHDLAALDAGLQPVPAGLRAAPARRRRRPAAPPVSPLLAERSAVALDAARRTDGDVDPTVGCALTELGYDLDLELLPADGPRGARGPAGRVPGWRRIQLDRERHVVTVPRGVRLDLGATAKAWAADRAARGSTSALGTGVLVGARRRHRSGRAPPRPAAGWSGCRT